MTDAGFPKNHWIKFSYIFLQSLLEMHKVADSHGDAQLTDFIEGEYLKEQVEAQKEIGDLITKMKRAGDALGLHIIDKELQ